MLLTQQRVKDEEVGGRAGGVRMGMAIRCLYGSLWGSSTDWVRTNVCMRGRVGQQLILNQTAHLNWNVLLCDCWVHGGGGGGGRGKERGMNRSLVRVRISCIMYICVCRSCRIYGAISSIPESRI